MGSNSSSRRERGQRRRRKRPWMVERWEKYNPRIEVGG